MVDHLGKEDLVGLGVSSSSQVHQQLLRIWFLQTSHCCLPPSLPGSIHSRPHPMASPLPGSQTPGGSEHLPWHHQGCRPAPWNHCFSWSHCRLSLYPGGDSHAREQDELTSLSSCGFVQVLGTSGKPANTAHAAFPVSAK